MSGSTYRRQVQALIDRSLAPAALSAQFAAFARAERDKLIQSHQAPPVYDTYVDGKKDADESTVRPDGFVFYDFNLLGEAATFGLVYLIKRSLKDTGRFRNSWFVSVNGQKWEADLNTIPSDAEVMVTNPQPYARKMESGANGFKATQWMCRQAKNELAKRFPSLDFSVTFVLMPTALVPPPRSGPSSPPTNILRTNGRSRRSDRRAGAQLTYPAVVIKAKR